MISGLGRAKIKEFIHALHTDRVSVYIPAYTNCTAEGCGFDAVSRSAKNQACTTCLGKGRTIVWRHTYLAVRASWTDVGRPRYGGVVTTADLGDATLAVRHEHKGLFEQARDAEGAYVLLDERKLRVMSVDVNRVEGVTSVVVRLEIIRG
jgi:hypothetical protein